MKHLTNKSIILPLTIIVTVLAFLLTNQKQPNNSISITEKTHKNKSTQSESKTDTIQQPISPLPETVTILGKTKTQEKRTEVSSLDLQILYGLINSYRVESNLTKLSISPLLQDSATRKTRDMIENNYFDHSDANKNESWYLFQAAGYQYTFAGENLSVGNNTPWQVFEAWQKSPIHNEQLLKPEYLDMGLSANCTEHTIGKTASCLVVLHLGAR